MNTPHTPTPWHVMYPKAFDYRIVQSIGGREICQINGTYADFENSEENEDRHHADAKLIVEAVNHHNELITRLCNLVNEAKTVMLDLEQFVSTDDVPTSNLNFRITEAEETLNKVTQK